MRRSERRLVRLSLALVFVVASCSSKESGAPEAALAPQPSTVRVSMAEYRFVYGTRVQAGRVVFTVSNAGRDPHRLSLFALAEDAPPIDVQLRAPGGSRLIPIAQMQVLQPGERDAVMAVDLEPASRYAMASLWPSPDGQPDALLGMTTEFRTARLPRAATTPAP